MKILWSIAMLLIISVTGGMIGHSPPFPPHAPEDDGCPAAVGPGWMEPSYVRGLGEQAASEVVASLAEAAAFETVVYAAWVDIDCDGEEDLVLSGTRPVYLDRAPAAAMAVIFNARRTDEQPRVALWASSFEELSATPVLFVDLDGDGWRDIVTHSGETVLDLSAAVHLVRHSALPKLTRGALTVVPVLSESRECLDSLRAEALPGPDRHLVRMAVHPQFGDSVAGCGFARQTFTIFSNGIEAYADARPKP